MFREYYYALVYVIRYKYREKEISRRICIVYNIDNKYR